ncbi:MAG: NAD-dependent epimerase/dehydratase family protein [Patescibacteria group bacterium]|jgi:nucleoside-diphosphate-sugar epimerase
MQALVTGGAGFIGSHLVDALLKRGARVVVVDNFSTGKEENLAHQSGNKALTVVRQDICSDLSQLFSEHTLDTVFHLAAIPRVQFSIKYPREAHQANVEGMVNVLEHSHQAKVKRFVFSSSSSVYGDQPTLPLTETMPTNPMSPYALHKLIGEEYCRLYASLYGMETVSLRYFNVFGPRMDPAGDYACLIPKFISLFLKNEPPIINGDGEQTRDFTFIDTVVAANIAAAETTSQELFGSIVNVGTGVETTVNAVAAMLMPLTGASKATTHGPAVIEPKNTRADITKLKTILKVEPGISLEDGCQKTIAALR